MAGLEANKGDRPIVTDESSIGGAFDGTIDDTYGARAIKDAPKTFNNGPAATLPGLDLIDDNGKKQPDMGDKSPISEPKDKQSIPDKSKKPTFPSEKGPESPPEKPGEVEQDYKKPPVEGDGPDKPKLEKQSDELKPEPESPPPAYNPESWY